MAIFTNRKPGWQQRDPEERLAAIHDAPEIPAADLAAMVRNDPDDRVRLAAAARIEEPELIRELLSDVSDAIADLLHQRLDHIYSEQLRQDCVPEEWPGMIEAIKSEEILVDICHGCSPVEVRLAASARVHREDLLAAIAAGPCGREVGERVVARINSQEIISGLIESAHGRKVRRLAAQRMKEIAPGGNEKKDEAADLLARAAALLKPADWDRAREEMAALAAEATILSDPQRLEFDRIRQDFDDHFRAIEERRREQAEKAAANSRCLAAYEEICQGIEELIHAPDLEAAGEEYIKLTDRWMTMREAPDTPLAPPAALERRFRKARKQWIEAGKLADKEKKTLSAWQEELAEISSRTPAMKALAALEALRKKVAAARVRHVDMSGFNAELDAIAARLTEAADQEVRDSQARLEEARKRRQQICAEIERLSRETPGRKGANRVKELRDQWHKLPADNDPVARELDQRYHQALEKFHACHQEFIHEQEWRLWANFTVKERLAREAEALDAESDPAKVYELIRDLQRQWKEAGGVPKRESEKLWQRFHQACERNFERCRPYLAERDEKRKALREEHKGFRDRALELAESDDFAAASAELKKMQARWKEDGIGVDREDFRLYKEFRRACNRFFSRRHEDYESRARDREKNLEAKLLLCEEAEKLAAEPDWNLGRRFTELQKQWKKIGPVPKSHDPEVWNRFRAACNSYFDWLDTKRRENQAAKEELLALAVELIESDDHAAAAASVRELQQRWKEIGPVPREKNESLWQEFRTACDQVFSRLRGEREENERRKLDICYRAEELAAGDGDEKEIAEALKGLQEEWKNIGQAEPAVERELYRRLKETCDAFFSGRRDRMERIRAQRADNLKRKEALCLRLENLVGATSEEALAETDASALAAALKQAMLGNVIAACASDKERVKKEEIKNIQQQWRGLGPVDRKHEQRLNQRFRKALDIFYNS